MRLLRCIALIAISVALHSCFTGVESTPRIGASEVKRETAATVIEGSLPSRIAPEPFESWLPGKKFLVDDSRIRLLFTPILPSDIDLTGHTLLYAGTRNSTDIAGKPMRNLLMVDSVNPYDTLIYRLPAESRVEIPFTIELSVVDSAREALTGDKFYILTRNRRDSVDNIIPGRRYVPVTVEAVDRGTSANPIRLTLTDDRQSTFYLFLPSAEATRSPRRFGAVLSVNDPRKRYPQISDRVWEEIIEGRVTDGMTRDECRLALGKPATIDRLPGTSYLYERWIYDNGVYLLFEDGILTRYRR